MMRRLFEKMFGQSFAGFDELEGKAGLFRRFLRPNKVEPSPEFLTKNQKKFVLSLGEGVRKRVAFTLAEVLITIGIIGVVATMVIPSLMYKIQVDQLHTKFKKTYSEFNQMSLRFMNDNNESIPSWLSEHSYEELIEEFNEYSKSNHKFEKYTFHEDEGQYRKYSFDGVSSNQFSLCDQSAFYSDIAGRVFSFDDKPLSGYNGPRMCLDLNGSQKPNIIGIDMFDFIFTVDGRVIPEGEPDPNSFYDERGPYWSGTTMFNKNYCFKKGGSTAGYTCAYFAFHDINPKGEGTYWKDFIGKKQYIN